MEKDDFRAVPFLNHDRHSTYPTSMRYIFGIIVMLVSYFEFSCLSLLYPNFCSKEQRSKCGRVCWWSLTQIFCPPKYIKITTNKIYLSKIGLLSTSFTSFGSLVLFCRNYTKCASKDNI